MPESDGASPARSDIRGLKQEFQALKQEHEQVKRRVAQLEEQRNDAVDALAAATGLSRRQVMGIIAGGASMGALGTLAVGEAQAAASTSDSEGDIGGPSNRHDFWTDGINYNVAAISSASTVSAPVVRYDCSVSGFTITLDSALEPSDGTQCVVLIDETGSAGSNSVTVDTQSGNNIDGGSSITINHNNAVTVLWWDGSEWRSTRFIDTVDARSLVIGGTLYVEDGNSPIDVTGTSSTTYTLATNAEEVIIVPDRSDVGFDQLQVNGDSNSNYDSTDNSDTETTGQTEWPMQFSAGVEYIWIGSGFGRSRLVYRPKPTRGTGRAVYGQNTNTTPPITQFTLSDSGSANRTAKARVYRRDMSV